VGTTTLLPAALPPSFAAEEAAAGQNRNSAYDTDSITSGLYTHGLRNGLREISLCFDLYDDSTGLPEVLDALKRFGIRATFFLNGEFIRRHPAAAGDILDAGHEAASMFFAAIDLSDGRYISGADFVSRGLARNEDEFYRATGSELAILWHPPYYAASPEIIAAAAAAGYKTTGRDVDPMDWVSREDEKRAGLPQYSASEMIDLAMERIKNGSIIPIRLGLLSGGRSDYLFNRINVLLDALIRSGYTLAPVSTLIEHSK
jgi:peptidoglycan/xylan/chitin deacetylase (PgdA/CDA1 family)